MNKHQLQLELSAATDTTREGSNDFNVLLDHKRGNFESRILYPVKLSLKLACELKLL